MKDPLGDKLKVYERAFNYKPSGDKPIIIRLDGKNFSKYTKSINCKKPFDEKFFNQMKEVTEQLVLYCDADVGYTQSDEISLILTKKNENQELFFGGKFMKLCSVLSSLATYHFNKLSESDTMALFDCRVFEVPDKKTAVECLEWRAEDCRRNSVSCLAQSVFSHKHLQNKSVWEMKLELKESGNNWIDLPECYRNGIYIKRSKVVSKFTTEEIESLPEKHQARTNPNLEVERTVIDYVTSSIIDSKNKEEFVWG